MNKKLMCDELTITVYPVGQNMHTGIGDKKSRNWGREEGSKTFRDRITKIDEKEKSKESSVIRKSIAIMKGWIQPKKICKRDISKRSKQAKERHKERMNKARTSKSPIEQKRKSSTSTNRSNRSLLNITTLNQPSKNLYSPRHSNPTFPSTPQFNSSKLYSIFTIASSRRSWSKF